MKFTLKLQCDPKPLMITNINVDVLDTTIITELYRIRWQIELLFKVLKSTFSIDQTLLSSKGRGISIQRFYTLFKVDLYPFYTLKRGILHSYATLCDILVRIGNLSLNEKRMRQTTYSRIESYLEEILQFGKT